MASSRDYVKVKVKGQKSRPLNHPVIGRRLRTLGLLPKGYRLNRLNENQKDRIRKLANKYTTQVNNVEFFKPLKVKSRDREEIKRLGIPMKKNIALFQTHGAESITYDPKRGRVIRKFKSKTQIQELERGRDIFTQAREFFRRRKPGEYLMLQVGDKNVIGRAFYKMRDFEFYIEAFKRKYGEEKWKELLPYLYIVKVKAPADKFELFASDEDQQEDDE